MRYDEALQSLGLQRGADAQAVRKAYVRKVKQHSPERDPEGFKRVRTAYEVLRSLTAEFEATGESGAAPTGPSASQTARLDDADSARTALAPCASPTASDPLATVRQRLLTERDPWQRIIVAKNAALELGIEQAYWLWVEELGPDAGAEELAPIARDAIARGHAEFLSILRGSCGALLTDDELADWFRDACLRPDAQTPKLVQLALDRGYPSTAADLLKCVLESYARDPQQPRQPAGDVVRIALELFARGAEHEAAQCLRAFEAAYSPDERAGLSPVIALTGAELSSHYDRLDPSIVAAMAAGVLNEAPESADRALRSVVRKSPAHAKGAYELLKSSAPTLFGLYGAALREIEPDLASWARRVRRVPIGIAGGGFWLVYLLFRLIVVSHIFDCGANPSANAAPANVHAPLWAAADALCASQPALCASARESVAAQDCGRASRSRELLDERVREVSRAGELTMREMLEIGQIRSATLRICMRKDSQNIGGAR